MAIASYAERDRQIAAMIKDEIERLKHDQRRFGWVPNTGSWNRAFGKLSGFYTILALVEDKPVPSERELGNQLAPPANRAVMEGNDVGIRDGGGNDVR